jgi:cadmium resistance protein CadD (predicted permease)
MGLLGLAIVVFVSTNIDDVFVLVGFFADPEFNPVEIVMGQYVGISALFAISVVGSKLALAISPPYVGLFGLFPIALGAKKLFDLYRNREQRNIRPAHSNHLRSNARAATVALVTVANGADNIGVYIPTFAIHTGYQIGVIAVVFAVMTASWCFFAHWLVRHPALGAPIRRYSHRVTPLVLIGIGVLIIFEAGSVALLIRFAH